MVKELLIDKPSRPDFSDVKAVLFDLDDTLCTYWDASKAALRTTFERFCPMGHKPKEMLEHWAVTFREFAPALKSTGWYPQYLKSGEPTRTEQMRLTLERAGIEDDWLTNRLSQCYMEERDRRLELFPGALELLDQLISSYTLGLITNGPADVQRQEIATLKLESYFPHIFIEGEMEMGKPSPKVFELVQNHLGLKASEILFVGNSYYHDIAPAQAAGWRTCWIRRESDLPPSSTPGEQPEQLPADAVPPDFITDSLRELLAVLAK